MTDGYDAFVALLDRRVTEAYPGAEPEAEAPEDLHDTATIPVVTAGRIPGPRRAGIVAGGLALVVAVVVGGVVVSRSGGGSGDQWPDPAALTAVGDQSSVPSSSPDLAGTPRSSTSPTQTPVKHDGKAKKTDGKADSPDGSKGGTKSGGKATPKPAGAQPQDATTSTASSGQQTSQAAATTTVTTVGVLRNLMTSFCADLPGRDSAAANSALKQYTCSSGTSDNQEYQTVAQPDGTFLLRNVKSQLCLDLGGEGSVATGSAVIASSCVPGAQDNQMWRKQYQGSGFFLVHVKSGLCLNISNPNGVDNKVLGLNITLFTCSATDDHIWQFG